jgi:hypothetical protein
MDLWLVRIKVVEKFGGKEQKMSRLFKTKNDAKNFVRKKTQEVEKNNKKDGAPLVGDTTTRYIESSIEEVHKDTDIPPELLFSNFVLLLRKGLFF